MRKILTGQILLILCCFFYLVWWYRGYRPGSAAERVGGVNGVLFLITAALGLSGLYLSLMSVPEITRPKISPVVIIIAGVLSYFLLLLITRYAFHRIVTSELFLIVGWTSLEISVANRLNAAGFLSEGEFAVICIVVAAAFLISMVLYVAYYRMEEMKAFYAAMVPLITEAASMAVLTGMLLIR